MRIKDNGIKYYLGICMYDSEMKMIFTDSLTNLKELNYGIVLVGAYFILEFGSIQGLYPIVGELMIPYIVSFLTVLYSAYLIFKKKVSFKSDVSKRFVMICMFIIIYTGIATKLPIVKDDTIKLFVIYLSQYIIIVTCVKKPTQFILLVDIWLLAIAFSSYNAILQGGLIWGNRWLDDENQISLLVVTAIPFAIMLYMIPQLRTKKLFYLMCLALFMGVNIAAASRGGALAMIVVTFLCWLLMRSKFRYFMIVSLTVILVFSFAPQKYFDEMKTLEQGIEEGTADDRIYLWGVAVDMFKNNLFLGVGPMNYSADFSEYEKGNRYPQGAMRVAHSTPVQWLAEMGIIGCFMLLSLQVALYKNWKMISMLKNNKDNSPGKIDAEIYINISHACVISQVGFWFAASFLTLMSHPFYWCLIPFSEAWKNISLDAIKIKR